MTTNDENRYFEEPLATHLEAKRGLARTKRRIIYDCFNAILNDGRVRCAKGYFSPFPLLTVLRGRSMAACVKCLDYDDGGEPCG